MTAGVPLALADFAGLWRLDRRIEDAREARTLIVEGRAEIAPDGQGGLIYDETVTMHLPEGGPLTGTRRYLWRPDANAIAVLFEDGRPFHRIVLGGSQSRDSHDCAPDRYDGQYDFSRWPDWQARWAVRGPRKTYVMVTRLRPAETA